MTIHDDVKFKLDGHTQFKVGDETYRWNDNWIDLVNVWSGDAGKTYTSTVQLSGSNWGMATMRFVGEAHMKVEVVDLDNGSNRWIDFLQLGNAGSTVTLKSTGFGTLDGSDAVDKITAGAGYIDNLFLNGGSDIVKLGSGGVGSIYLDDGNDQITMGKGDVAQMSLGNGNDTVIGAKGDAGDCDSVVLGNGNNVFTGNDSWVGMLSANSGDDKITIGNGGVDMIRASGGTNVINVVGSGYVGSILAFEGNDTVNIKGTNSVDSVAVGSGNNIVSITGSGWVGNIITNEGDDVIKALGSHNIGSIVAGTGNNTVKTGDFFVSAITCWDNNDTVTVGSGGVGHIWLYNGSNTVATTSGWVGSLLLGDGTDTVSLGSGGSAQVTMYGGKDSLSVSQLSNADDICMFNGGKGIDSISFANFTANVSMSLASSDAVDTGAGIFIIYNFENLTTGSGDDALMGNTLANTLDGGAGTNMLAGGGGADIFVYADLHDTDTITDFTKAQGDKIDLSGLTGFDSFSDLSSHMAQNGANTEISDGSGHLLILQNVTMGDLTAGQFVF